MAQDIVQLDDKAAMLIVVVPVGIKNDIKNEKWRVVHVNLLVNVKVCNVVNTETDKGTSQVNRPTER